MTNQEFVQRLQFELERAGNINCEDVYNGLEKYTLNKRALKEATDHGMLLYEYNYLKNVIEGGILEDALWLMKEIVQKAYSVNREKTVNILEEYSSNISKGLADRNANIWAVEFKKQDSFDVFVKKALSLAGDGIETTLKPYVSVLFLLTRINKDIKKVPNLGNMLNELMNNSDILKAIYKDMFFDISLADWRNIDAHNNYTVLEDTIVVEYGNNKKELTKRNIETCLWALDGVLYMHKITFLLLFLDYSEEIKGKEKGFCNTDISKLNITMQIVESAKMINATVLKVIIERKKVVLQITELIDEQKLIEYCMLLVGLLGGSVFIVLLDRNNKRIRIKYEEGKLLIY